MLLILIKTVLILFITAVLFFIFIYRIALKKLYKPQSDEASSNRLAEMSNVEEIVIEDCGSSLYGWWFHCGSSKAPVIIYYCGTGAACYTASKRLAAGLVLIAPYSDGYDLYNGYFNIFYGPLRRLIAFRMESVKYALGINLPVLILASEDDRIVRYSTSLRLTEAFVSKCRLIAYKGISHHDLWMNEEVMYEIRKFTSSLIYLH